MTNSFNILVNKLNAFRSKYYSFKLIRGAVTLIFLLIVLYTVFSIVEYVNFLSTDVRKILFYGFIIFGMLLLIQFIIIPLFRLLKILKPINLKDSTLLIQKHFPDIQDKLLNIIELSNLENSQYSNDIVIASIDQKIDELKVFDFNKAVDFSKIRLIALYLLVSILVVVGIFFINKRVFTESTQRLVHYNKEFVKPAPFSFSLTNDNLKAKKGDSFTIKAKAKGDEIPKIVYINIEGNNYLMNTVSAGEYEFKMASVINPVTFYFTDLKYNSSKYNLKLLPKPGITSFKLSTQSPGYTGLKSKVLDNIGDVQIANGSAVEWRFKGIDIDSLFLVFNDSSKVFAKKINNEFIVDSKFYKSTNYNVFIKNIITKAELALSYSIEVIPDLFPEIKVRQTADSTKLTRFFFKGIINDDYGFSSLKFHYNINNEDSAVSIPVLYNVMDQEFYYSVDFDDYKDNAGIISYYFSVSDNDVINHYKTTTSSSFTFNFPDEKQLQEHDKEQFEKIEKMLAESQKLSNDIQNDLNNLQIKNMNSNVSDWEKSQMVKDIVQKQNKLQQMYDKIKQDNKNLNNYLNSFDKNNEELVNKQKEIEKLLEEVFTDELRELMDEFNKLADDFNSKKLNQLTDKMNLTMDDLQKQLDRNLEMLKKMKIESKFQDVIDDLNKMAADEEQLSKEINENKNYDEVSEKVQKHKESLDELQKRLEDAMNMNKELNEPMSLDEFKDEFNEINKSIEESKENLGKKNKKKSGESMKNTSEQMKNTAYSMQQMLDSNSSEQNQENIQNLRQILSNLIHLSFNQEEVLNGLNNISSKDPRLVEFNKRQKKILDQSDIVKDSLYSLAMRTPQLTSTVNNELVSMELNLNNAMNNMEEGLFRQARSNQQFVMTAANNLALLLNEALDNLEKQQANSKPGDGECNNPGGKGAGMEGLKKSSESIKKQLEKMIDQMKNGNSKGQKQGMSQQMGESLMQHEMMQQMLRDLMNNGDVGSGTKQVLKKIDDMLDKNRKELMNKTIDAQTIARQNLITTRLLEAEKAEKEREFEEKRESESANDFYSNPIKFFKQEKNDNISIEYLNKNTHKLNNFYSKKYKSYITNVNKVDE